jgi:two-component system capsular synthesis sensor histidine kinase RcsC
VLGRAFGTKVGGKKQFEIVLTDYHMPGMNGNELVKSLRRQDSDVLIIGFSIADEKRTFLNAGANTFISKDELFTDLMPIINILKVKMV